VSKTFFVLGSLFAGIGVAAGAFGAHALASTLSSEALTTFETGVRYQMYHAFALLALAGAISRWPGSMKLFKTAGWLFTAGILFFSVSLYALAVTGMSWLGAITPVGGVAFVLAWLLLLIGAWRG
jgi:uncharacterized membrane protein YgdD (TMEM256/DUF423 family)